MNAPPANAFPQLHADGRLRHLLTLEGLPASTLTALLDAADGFGAGARGGDALRARLAGRTVCTLFFEPSTRTRSSFQLAATRLGADTLVFDVSASSTSKGETALDTMRTLEAMGVDCFVVRHADNGAVAALAAGALPATAFVNAGDGRSAHPTQGLLDMLTIRRHKGADFSKLSVAMVGDIRHSRVARSDLQALRILGVRDIRVCGPQGLLPDANELQDCRVEPTLAAAIDGADVVMMLRLQRERMEEGLVPSLSGYYSEYGLNPQNLRLAARDAIVLHPGPMNRGVEIAGEVADGPQSVILEQVGNGVAVRMAVLEAVLAS
ncbi:MAG: aspartate carbamoyltransferase catalytic subunit [Arenimonas sp.]